MKNNTPLDSFETVLKETGTKSIPEFSDVEEEKKRAHHKAMWVWELIIEAYNKRRDPDYKADCSNHQQKRYFPVVILEKDESKPAGFGFWYAHALCDRTHTYVGARLSFAAREDVYDALEKFEKEYIATLI